MSLFAHPLRLTTVTHNITELLHGPSVRRRLSLEPISCTLRTSTDSAASNISSDASTEIALIMLIKLVCLLIGPVKVPILVCPGRLPRAIDPSGRSRRVKSSVILSVGRYNMLPSTLCFYVTYSFGNNFRHVARLYRAGYYYRVNYDITYRRAKVVSVPLYGPKQQTSY